MKRLRLALGFLFSAALLAAPPVATITLPQRNVTILEGGRPWPSFITPLKQTLFGTDAAISAPRTAVFLNDAQKNALRSAILLPFPKDPPLPTIKLTPGKPQAGASYLAVVWGVQRAKLNDEQISLMDSNYSPMSGLGISFATTPGKTYLLDLVLQNGGTDSQWQLFGQASATFQASTVAGGDHHYFGFVANESLELFLVLYTEGATHRIGNVYSATLTQVD